MQIPKSFLAACAATFLLGPTAICRADDSPTTNAPPASEMKTNETQAAQSKPLSKAEKKKQAEEKKKAELAAKKQAEADAKARTNAPPATVKAPPGLKPIAAPPLPISSDKQQRLTELLQQYKADKLTPEQYHTERAKILAEQ